LIDRIESRSPNSCYILKKAGNSDEEIEMVHFAQNVSTRKVNHITEELCGAGFSKSTFSQLWSRRQNQSLLEVLPIFTRAYFC